MYGNIMADDRQIIFSSYVSIKESADFEESIPSKWIIHPGVGRTLGGKGISTDSGNTQWSQGWSSMQHPNMHWEDYSNNTDFTGHRWDDIKTSWSDNIDITTSPYQVTRGHSTAIDVDVAFFYIKNKSTSNDVLVSLNGSGGFYYIKVAPNGSVCLRGGDSSFHCDDVYIKSSSGTISTEFILANK